MIIRCIRCCLPSTRPDTQFTDGVCGACLAYQRRPTIDWGGRKKDLLNLLDRHNGRCIVPSSAGKDSHAQVLMLRELGADVTAVTATTCMLTSVGRKNIDNLARYCNTVEYTPNLMQRAKLNRLGLEMVGDISHPEHMAIFTVPFRAAVELNIPLVFYGENPQEAYSGPTGTDKVKEMTRRWVSEFGGYNGLRHTDIAEMGYDMRYYTPPSADALAHAGVEAHFLGQYIGPWNSHRNADLAIAHGFQCELPTLANRWTSENQDNHQTGTHDFFGFLKYGYGRGAAQISVDIRYGLITREEALMWVTEYDGLFPLTYMRRSLDEILDHISMTRQQFLGCCNAFLNRSLFVQDRVEWGTHLILKE